MDGYEKLYVCTKEKEYPIYIYDTFSALTSLFYNFELTNKKVFVVTDSNVSKLYAEEFFKSISEVTSEAYSFEIGENEEYKSLDEVLKVYAFCVENKIDKTSIIIALGGGIVCDVAGYVAATLMRGLTFIQVPTTISSQVESSISGKVVVNYAGQKNIIGTHYYPKFVYINIATVTTLPRSSLIGGLLRMLRAGLAWNEKYVNFIIQNQERIKCLDPEAVSGLLYGACSIRAEIFTKAEREPRIKDVLRFGNRFAYGFESVSNYAISHDSALAIGCYASLCLSSMSGRISKEEFALVASVYKFFNIQSFVTGYSAEEVYEHMLLDKKASEYSNTFILLHKIGDAYATSTARKEEIIEALKMVIQ